MEDGVLGIVRVFYAASSPTTWTQVGQILDCKIPTDVQARVDTTVYATTKRKRSIPGMVETSALEMKLLYDPDETTTEGAKQKALRAYRAAGTTIYWRVEVCADRGVGAKWKPFEFQGYVESWEPAAPMNERVELDVKVAFDDNDVYELYAGTSEGTDI